MPYPGSERPVAVEMAALARDGINRVVSLLEPSESIGLGLEDEAQLAQAESMSFTNFPIPDMGVPVSAQDFATLARDLYQEIDAGGNVLVHCRGGIGRSGLLAATILLQAGMDIQEAFARVSRQRGCRVPETSQQGEWLLRNQDLVRGMQVAG